MTNIYYTIFLDCPREDRKRMKHLAHYLCEIWFTNWHWRQPLQNMVLGYTSIRDSISNIAWSSWRSSHNTVCLSLSIWNSTLPPPVKNLLLQCYRHFRAIDRFVIGTALTKNCLQIEICTQNFPMHCHCFVTKKSPKSLVYKYLYWEYTVSL